MTTALIPGSFDPIHNGHVQIFDTASALFDRVIIAAVRNPSKGNPMFEMDERKAVIAEALGHLDNFEIVFFEGLLVDLAKEVGADVMVKGLRGVSDFDVEVQMAQMNDHMAGILTLFLPSKPAISHLSSSLIREIARLGGSVSDMVPSAVAGRLQQRFAASPSGSSERT